MRSGLTPLIVRQPTRRLHKMPVRLPLQRLQTSPKRPYSATQPSVSTNIIGPQLGRAVAATMWTRCCRCRLILRLPRGGVTTHGNTKNQRNRWDITPQSLHRPVAGQLHGFRVALRDAVLQVVVRENGDDRRQRRQPRRRRLGLELQLRGRDVACDSVCRLCRPSTSKWGEKSGLTRGEMKRCV